MSFFPQIKQGYLNRILTHVVVTDYPTLNVTASYMSKAMATLTFDGDFVEQIPTATDIVNSPAPFVMGNLTFNILRSQTLAALYLAQVQTAANIGTVVAYPDSTVFAPITLYNSSVTGFDPGPYDGTDPTTKITVKGVFRTNVELWNGNSGA